MNRKGIKDSEYIIRRILVPHCARGPQRCERCREMAQEKKICLLKIHFTKSSIARPVIEVYRQGERRFGEFEIEKIFKDENDAKDYAKKNAITDVELTI